MKNDIKIVFSDLDGTLLTDDKRMPYEVIESIHRLKDKGILFGIASGRTKLTLDKLMPEYGISECIDAKVCMNGNVVSLNGNTDIYYPLTYKEVKYIYDNSKRFDDIAFCVYKEESNTFYCNYVNETVKEVVRINNYNLEVKDMDKWLTNKSFLKCMYTGTNDRLLEIYDEVKRLETKDIRFSKTSPRMYEINSTKVSKAFGIKKICEKLNINMDNVMCIGDSENDIEMLEEAGIGVCVSNAYDNVKKIADYITPKDNNHGGVAHFLNCYFKLDK